MWHGGMAQSVDPPFQQIGAQALNPLDAQDAPYGSLSVVPISVLIAGSQTEEVSPHLNAGPRSPRLDDLDQLVVSCWWNLPIYADAWLSVAVVDHGQWLSNSSMASLALLACRILARNSIDLERVSGHELSYTVRGALDRLIRTDATTRAA